jgi:hypothetical protein
MARTSLEASRPPRARSFADERDRDEPQYRVGFHHGPWPATVMLVRIQRSPMVRWARCVLWTTRRGCARRGEAPRGAGPASPFLGSYASIQGVVQPGERLLREHEAAGADPATLTMLTRSRHVRSKLRFFRSIVGDDSCTGGQTGKGARLRPERRCGFDSRSVHHKRRSLLIGHARGGEPAPHHRRARRAETRSARREDTLLRLASHRRSAERDRSFERTMSARRAFARHASIAHRW